jgi:hypothetical protein
MRQGFAYFMEFRGTTGFWYPVRWTIGMRETRPFINDGLYAWRKYLDMKRQFEPLVTRLCKRDLLSKQVVVID